MTEPLPIMARWFVNFNGSEYGPFANEGAAKKFFYDKFMKDPELAARFLPSCPTCEE